MAVSFRVHEREVYGFMKKQNFPIKQDLTVKPANDLGASESIFLSNIATRMYSLANELDVYADTHSNSTRTARAQLMTEELAETIDALIMRNEEKLLDGLSDLLFVTLGTAITFDMPIEEGHLEVVRSNLSKAVRDPDNNARIRDKGPNYVAPNMKKVLETYRSNSKNE